VKKIPTLFVRDFEQENGQYVTDQVTPGCEWVLAGVGTPTRKYDGTCVLFDGEKWWARREVKPGKEAPPNFAPIDHDDETGKTVGWEPIEQSGFAKFHAEVLASEEAEKASNGRAVAWHVGTYELIGPKINGNPEGWGNHDLIYHAWAAVVPDLSERTFDALRYHLTTGYPDEGIVWHHPDGRMAKLKVRDFPGGVRVGAGSEQAAPDA
jgi:hypothetical protein